MSYFGRLAEQAGLSVAASNHADPSVAVTLTPVSQVSASPSDAPPDMPEIDEVIEVAAPSPPATVPPAARPDRKPLSNPDRKAAEPAESPLAAPQAPQPQAIAFDDDPLAPSPAAAAADSVRPAPDPIQAEPSLLRQALKWVASDPVQALERARVPSPEGAKPDVIDAATRPAESAAQRPRVGREQNEPLDRIVPARLPLLEDGFERAPAPPQATAALDSSPTAISPPLADLPAQRIPSARAEAQVEEVVQVSIGNIHVRVETPAPSAMPEPAPAIPRAAPARPPQAPSARLRRRYLHL